MADPFDFEKADRYAVMGNPVAHSKSPRIHALFAHQFRHAIEYTAIQVDAGGFAQAVDQFRANGGKGLMSPYRSSRMPSGSPTTSANVPASPRP